MRAGLVNGISPNLDMQRDWKETPYNWTLQFIRLPQKSEELDAQVQIVNWMEAGIVKAEE